MLLTNVLMERTDNIRASSAASHPCGKPIWAPRTKVVTRKGRRLSTSHMSKFRRPMDNRAHKSTFFFYSTVFAAQPCQPTC